MRLTIQYPQRWRRYPVIVSNLDDDEQPMAAFRDEEVAQLFIDMMFEHGIEDLRAIEAENRRALIRRANDPNYEIFSKLTAMGRGRPIEPSEFTARCSKGLTKGETEALLNGHHARVAALFRKGARYCAEHGYVADPAAFFDYLTERIGTDEDDVESRLNLVLDDENDED